MSSATALLQGLVRKGRGVGMDIVEVTPKHGLSQTTWITAGRLIANLASHGVRAGHFG